MPIIEVERTLFKVKKELINSDSDRVLVNQDHILNNNEENKSLNS